MRDSPDATGLPLCQSGAVCRTVLVVDDHPGFRAIARALAVSAGLNVVADAASGAEAIAQCEAFRPDLVLLDIGLPDVDGFTVREHLLARPAPPAVLLTSSRSAASWGERLRSPTMIPFVPKDELSVRALLRALGTG